MMPYALVVLAAVSIFGVFLAGLVHGSRLFGRALDLGSQFWPVIVGFSVVFGFGYILGRWGFLLF